MMKWTNLESIRIDLRDLIQVLPDPAITTNVADKEEDYSSS
jgi:hypothetical protein